MNLRRSLVIGSAAVLLIGLLLFKSRRIAMGDWKCYSEGSCVLGDFPRFTWQPAMLWSDTLYDGAQPIAILVNYSWRPFRGDVIAIRRTRSSTVSEYVDK